MPEKPSRIHCRRPLTWNPYLLIAPVQMLCLCQGVSPLACTVCPGSSALRTAGRAVEMKAFSVSFQHPKPGFMGSVAQLSRSVGDHGRCSVRAQTGRGESVEVMVEAGKTETYEGPGRAMVCILLYPVCNSTVKSKSGRIQSCL
jgi:hypothetical protein